MGVHRITSVRKDSELEYLILSTDNTLTPDTIFGVYNAIYSNKMM